MNILRKAALIAGVVVVGTVLGADAPKANVQLIMLTKVNPQGLALWEITSAALGDDGDVEASKVTAAQWAKLLEIGKGLEEGGRIMATGNGVVAAAPGAKLQDEGNEGASKAADVQRYLDAKPAVFREHAVKLQQTGTDVVAAATKRDAKRLSDVSNSLDAVCAACHVIFWYPQQKK